MEVFYYFLLLFFKITILHVYLNVTFSILFIVFIIGCFRVSERFFINQYLRHRTFHLSMEAFSVLYCLINHQDLLHINHKEERNQLVSLILLPWIMLRNAHIFSRLGVFWRLWCFWEIESITTFNGKNIISIVILQQVE